MRQGYLFALICVALGTSPVLAQDAKPFARIEVKGKYRWVTKSAFSPDGKTFAAAHCHSFGPTFVTLFDASTGKRIREVEGPQGVFNWNPITFSPNGKWFAVAGMEELLLFHADGKRADKVSIEDANVEALAFHPNSGLLATGSWLTGDEKKDNNAEVDNVIIWSLATTDRKTELKRTASLRIERMRVVRMAFSSDGKTLTAVGQDIDTGWMVRVWDTSTLKPIRTFTGKKNEPFESVDISSDGRHLAFSTEKRLELWSTVDGKRIRTIECRGDTWNNKFTNDGSAVVMGYFQIKDNKYVAAELEIIEIQSGKVLAKCKMTSEPAEKLFGPNFGFSPNGDVIAIQVAIDEFTLWHSKALIGVPLTGKKKE